VRGRVDLLGDADAGIPPAMLDEVSWCEEFIADRLALTRTRGAARDAQLAADGVYFIADQLFHWYAAGGFGQVPQAEALKRATWFCWASAALPCEESGVDALDDDAVHRVLTAVLDHLVRDRHDDELLDMLAWYHARAPMAFDRFADLDALAVAAAARAPEGWRLRGWDREQFHGRGAMGRYWTRVLTSYA
jgi:hypothetical protein